jgi:hypothetical protein
MSPFTGSELVFATFPSPWHIGENELFACIIAKNPEKKQQ